MARFLTSILPRRKDVLKSPFLSAQRSKFFSPKSASSGSSGIKLRPRWDLNPDFRLRRPTLCPLSYEDIHLDVRRLSVAISNYASAERIWLDYGVKAVALDHADDGFYKVLCRAVFANVNVNLVIPEKFVPQFFFKP